MNFDQTSLRALRLLTVLESTSLVVLIFVAVPLKHVAQYDAAVSVMGPVHGMAFLLYSWMVASTAASRKLPGSEIMKLLVAALVPFGGFVTLAWIARQEADR